MKNLKDRVTIYQVAQAADVSLATVSRVINKQGNVTEATRKKVEDTIARLGYKPSGLAQALATNKTTNIGIVIPSANYVYISNFLNGITLAAKDKGLTLTLFTTSHSHEEAMTAMEKVISSHVDGAIIFDDELDADDVAKITSYNVPIIVVNNRITGDRIGCVELKYQDAFSEMIREYQEKIAKHDLTFLHVHNCGRLLARCEKTFVTTNEQLNKPYKVINCDDSYTRTYNEFRDYFQTNRSGFFIAYRDSIAIAVMNAAIDAGLRVPEDVEVMALVGTKYSFITRPTITSMSIDMAEVGKRAMYMLIDLMNHELRDKVNHFDAQLVTRNSTLHESTK